MSHQRNGKWSWDIPIPDQGDLDEEQTWAVLADLASKMERARNALGAGWRKIESPMLSEDERDELMRACRTVEKLAERFTKSPLELLAEVAPKPDDQITWSHEVDATLEYGHPIERWIHKHDQAELVTLAMSHLGDYDDLIPDFLEKLSEKRERDRHYNRKTGEYEMSEWSPPVWPCPRCECRGHIGGPRYAKTKCKLCRGWGFVISVKEPDYREEELSEKGREALNEGRQWTIEDEVVACGYESLEDAREDDWRPPEFFEEAA